MPILELKKEKPKGKGAPKKPKKKRKFGFPNMEELNRARAVSKGRAMKRGGPVDMPKRTKKGKTIKPKLGLPPKRKK